MKVIRFTAILAIVALAGTVGAMAQTSRDQVSAAKLPGVGLGELYDRSLLLPEPDGSPVPLPTPVDPALANAGLSKSGPTASTMPIPMQAGDGTGGLLTPRGGAMSTPKQRADRQIRQLIRRLD